MSKRLFFFNKENIFSQKEIVINSAKFLPHNNNKFIAYYRQTNHI